MTPAEKAARIKALKLEKLQAELAEAKAAEATGQPQTLGEYFKGATASLSEGLAPREETAAFAKTNPTQFMRAATYPVGMEDVALEGVGETLISPAYKANLAKEAQPREQFQRENPLVGYGLEYGPAVLGLGKAAAPVIKGVVKGTARAVTRPIETTKLSRSALKRGEVATKALEAPIRELKSRHEAPLQKALEGKLVEIDPRDYYGYSDRVDSILNKYQAQQPGGFPVNKLNISAQDALIMRREFDNVVPWDTIKNAQLSLTEAKNLSELDKAARLRAGSLRDKIHATSPENSRLIQAYEKDLNAVSEARRAGITPKTPAKLYSGGERSKAAVEKIEQLAPSGLTTTAQQLNRANQLSKEGTSLATRGRILGREALSGFKEGYTGKPSLPKSGIPGKPEDTIEKTMEIPVSPAEQPELPGPQTIDEYLQTKKAMGLPTETPASTPAYGPYQAPSEGPLVSAPESFEPAAAAPKSLEDILGYSAPSGSTGPLSTPEQPPGVGGMSLEEFLSRMKRK